MQPVNGDGPGRESGNNCDCKDGVWVSVYVFSCLH